MSLAKYPTTRSCGCHLGPRLRGGCAKMGRRRHVGRATRASGGTPCGAANRAKGAPKLGAAAMWTLPLGPSVELHVGPRTVRG
eukprot:5465013-Pyramimonas_sp.AAC.1